MQKLILLLFSLLSSAVLLSGCGPASDEKTGAEKESPIPAERIASRVADRLPHVHLNRDAFDDHIATNAFNLFIDSLDFDRTFFLASDVEEFRAEAALLDDQLRDGQVAFSERVFERFRQRVTNRVAYVYQLLDRGFDLQKEETYVWKRDKAPWAASREEWDDLWRRKVKNEYVARVAARETGIDEKAEDEAGSTNQTAAVTNEALAATNAVAEEILSPEEFVRERYKQYQLLVENNFDAETVLQRYLSAFARSYDPHTDYLSPRNVEDFDIGMSLSLVGIGAMLRSEDGAAKIQSLIPGGPAEQDGRLQPGDKIIAVAQGDEDPVSILHWPLSKAVRLIRGEKGTEVVLTIIPADNATGTRTKKIDLIRDEVKLEAQAAKSDLHEIPSPCGELRRLGVLTLPEFYADFEAARSGDAEARRASTDCRRILESFNTNDVDGVILDLRNDGGGSLTEAIDITGLFFPLGPVVQVRERRGVSVIPDGDPSTTYEGPLVVLVNRLSASASEIVAAALQDYGRAVIVGDSKTHGKGTVQTVYPLSRLRDDLGSLKVTTASFYRIKGGSTQIKGVKPDIVLPSLYDALEIGEEFLPNALPWSQVRSAYYRPWRDPVDPLLPELRRRSAQRMTNNPAFTAFLTRRERIRERMENPVVSLKLADRIDEITAEQELDDLQESLLDSDKSDKDDPILDEALNILADLVDLRAGKAMVADTEIQAALP